MRSERHFPTPITDVPVPPAILRPTLMREQVGPTVSTEEDMRIDGVPIFGAENPLNEYEAKALVQALNTEFNSKPRPRDPKTFYSTWFVTQEEAERWPKDTGYENIVKFAQAHEEYLSKALQSVNDYVKRKGYLDEDLIEGVELRRIIIVDNESSYFGPGSWHEGWIYDNVADSNGTMGPGLGRPYVPQNAHWYFTKGGRGIDPGLPHEMNHWYIPGSDGYEANFDFREGVIPPALYGIARDWRYYHVHERNDYGDGLMNGGNITDRLDDFSSWLIARRARNWVGGIHNRNLSSYEATRFPGEVAPENVLAFGPEWKNKHVKIYRKNTYWEGNQKKTDFDEVVFEGRTDEKGEVNVGNPFASAMENGYIPVGKSSLMVRVDKNGDNGFRALSVHDFLQDRGLRKPLNEEMKLRMQMNLFTNDTRREDADWTVIHGDLEHKIYLPIIMR